MVPYEYTLDNLEKDFFLNKSHGQIFLFDLFAV